jgi:hypothetical protein
MYDGVKAMIEAEKALRPAVADCNCGPHIRKPEDITGFPVFPPGTHSLLSKHLTRDVWNQFKDAKD